MSLYTFHIENSTRLLADQTHYCFAQTLSALTHVPRGSWSTCADPFVIVCRLGVASERISCEHRPGFAPPLPGSTHSLSSTSPPSHPLSVSNTQQRRRYRHTPMCWESLNEKYKSYKGGRKAHQRVLMEKCRVSWIYTLCRLNAFSSNLLWTVSSFAQAVARLLNCCSEH